MVCLSGPRCLYQHLLFCPKSCTDENVHIPVALEKWHALTSVSEHLKVCSMMVADAHHSICLCAPACLCRSTYKKATDWDNRTVLLLPSSIQSKRVYSTTYMTASALIHSCRSNWQVLPDCYYTWFNSALAILPPDKPSGSSSFNLWASFVFSRECKS